MESIMLHLLLHTAMAAPNNCPITDSAYIDESAAVHYVRGDLVNLRKGPSTSDRIKAEIRLGTVVMAEGCEKKETIGGKDGCWHKVSLTQGNKNLRGYLFSTAISDCRIEGDFDGDGSNEYIFHAISSANDLQLRLHDPNDAPHVFWTHTQLAPSFSGNLSVHPDAAAGRDLLVVNQSIENTKQSDYFSFHPTLGIKEAATTRQSSDSSFSSSQTAQFFSSGKVVLSTKEGGNNGNRTERVLCFEQGVYDTCPTEADPLKRMYVLDFENRVVLTQIYNDQPVTDEIEWTAEGRSISLDQMNVALDDITSGQRDGTYLQLTTEEWWILPKEGYPVPVNVSRYVYSKWSCVEALELYSVELDIPNGVEPLLAVNGPPPTAWYLSPPPEPEPTAKEVRMAEELQRLTTRTLLQLNEQYPEEDIDIFLEADGDGWKGTARWCCPEAGKPLFDQIDPDKEYDYTVSVVIDTKGNISLGNLSVEHASGEADPILRKDIDGDGQQETLWMGECEEHFFWEKDEQSIKSTLYCCGC